MPIKFWGQASIEFVPNKGQWPQPFHTKLRLAKGAIFFTNTGYRLTLLNPPQHGHGHSHHSEQKQAYNSIWGHSFKMQFYQANKQPSISYGPKTGAKHNYFLGSNPNHWKSAIRASQSITYYQLYEGIHVKYYAHNNKLKYDLIVSSGADPKQIKQVYSGLNSIRLENGKLHLETELGQIKEWIPEAYQIIDGKKTKIKCHYVLKNNTISYKLEKYNVNYELVIDPVLDFSTFSGSGDLNFGNTATPGANGTAYAAGANFGANYPVTLGALQATFATDTVFSSDVSISKFSEDGSTLLYATYLGGTGSEVPQSIIADNNDNLYIMGTTGAADFPTTAQAFQNTFAGGNYIQNLAYNNFRAGCDIFISKISADGGRLMASTYWGGSGNDGFNTIEKNYSDNFRGELILTPNGKVGVVSSTNSINVSNGSLPNGAKTNNSQDALVGVFNANLSQNEWTSFLGGSQIDAGYSLKYLNNHLYITGGTNSPALPQTTNALQSTLAGDFDGFISKFDLSTGQNLQNTFIGTASYDQSFLLETDGSAVLVYGQTRGNWPISNAGYSVVNGTQFIAKLNADLNTVLWQTTVGSGQFKQDLVPSAFLVDNCQNLYLAGWNGGSNQIGNPSQQNGNTLGLPTTANSYQSNTDGSDFYFMILSRNADSLLYATYFGGRDEEHVDGGTSRFDSDGTVYQAVCSNCLNQSFPTTPGVYSNNAGSPGCNMAIFKFSFNQNVAAQANLNFTTSVDSICDGLKVDFTNNSLNATNYKWYFGNGDSSSLKEPTVTYRSIGTYVVTFIAIDTLCNLADTLTLEILHNQASLPEAKASASYEPCDAAFEAVLDASNSANAQLFTWLLPNGAQLNKSVETYQFGGAGPHQLKLIVTDTLCQRADTAETTVFFNKTPPIPQASLNLSSCSDGSVEVNLQNTQPWYNYRWSVNGKIYRGAKPAIVFTTTGAKTINLVITDSLCNRSYQQSFKLEVKALNQAAFIPSAFSPNGDGLNETFKIVGSSCNTKNTMQIANRWGEVIFKTNSPYQSFWNGNLPNGAKAPIGVYTYKLTEGEKITQGSFTLIR
jgi:gliding motility-associated-like protein